MLPGGRLVIVNLQKTPLTRMADLHIHARCDTVMTMVLEKLNLEILPWKLTRKVVLGTKFRNGTNEGEGEFLFSGTGIDPYNPKVIMTLFTRTEIKKKNGFVEFEEGEWIRVSDLVCGGRREEEGRRKGVRKGKGKEKEK
jgi:hypothetical protein